MSAQDSATAAAEPSYHFLLIKLHSLSGVLPIGAFVMFHLIVNASVLAGPETFQERVDSIHSLEPFVIPLEVAFIFLPIAFHAVLGVMIWWTSRSNIRHYPYAGNIRYTLQRITGLVVLVFILFHVWQLHWLGKPFGGSFFDAERPNAAYTTAKALQSAAWIGPFYAVGIIATCYHLANGLWTFLISWGITIGVNAQRKAGYACAAIGLLVCALGLAALWRFDRTPPEQLRFNQGGHHHAGWVVPPLERRVHSPVALTSSRANPTRNPKSTIRNQEGAAHG